MKKQFTKLLALAFLLFIFISNANAQLVTLVNSTFQDWTVAPPAASGDGVTIYNITGASILFKGTGYNYGGSPGTGTVDASYPNYFRFGSAMSPLFTLDWPGSSAVTMSNQFLRITPTSPFVNGGKITLTISSTSNNSGQYQVGDIATGSLLGTGILVTKNIRTDVVIDLPSDYNGIKQIAIGRNASTFFLHAIKIETNTSSTEANTNLKDLTVDGTTVTGFDPAVHTYDVALPYAYQGLPVVAASTNDANATANITQVTEIPGSATVNVTNTGVDPTLYTINFTRIPVSTACDITAFSINGQYGVINTSNNTISVNLSSNTDITSLTPVVTTSALATYTPGSAQNFSNPVDYVVTAEDGSTTKTYTVTVNLIAPYSGPYPYETTFPADFTIPAWMSSPTNGISFTNVYTGSDASLWFESGETVNASVLRLNSTTSVEFYVSKCSTVTAGLSATGSRLYNLYVNGVNKTNSGTISSNTKYELTYDVNLNEPVVIRVENTGNGGATMGYLKIESSFGTGLSQGKISGISFDGKTIHNDANLDLQVFDIAGKRVAGSNKNIDMTSNANGIYIVKSTQGTLKISLMK